MNIPEIANPRGFAFAPLHLMDEEGMPVLALLARASFDIAADGTLHPSPAQMPINAEGRLWGVAGESSYCYEPDIAFVKLATDVVLNGEAHAPARGTTAMDVSLRVGPLSKTLRVYGDRWWMNGLARQRISAPQAFERMALTYENAFGGWDRSSADPGDHGFEPRNPVGTGFHRAGSALEGARLPNVEDPESLIGSLTDHPAPASFGVTSPDWHPRARFGGTFDDAWTRGRSPLLPLDFDRRYFSAASPGLVAPGYLTGGEQVVATGVSPGGALSFALPGIASVDFEVRLRNLPALELSGPLDTVVIDAHRRRVHLTWRAHTLLRRGPQDVLAIDIGRELAVNFTAAGG